MEVAILVGPVFLLEYLLERFHNSKLKGDLSAYSEERHKHSFVEGQKSFFLNGFFEGVDVALVVLFGSGDDFNLDVFEREHGDYLPPAGGTSAEQVFGYFRWTSHKTNKNIS